MKVENRNIKYPRIELRTGELQFVLPLNMEHTPILEKYDSWIKEKKDEINKALMSSESLQLYGRTLDELRKQIYKLVSAYSKEQGLKVEQIIIRELKTKWGSCSRQGNLTFNKSLSKLPDTHIKYVVFHELMHMIERMHTPKYWQLVAEKFPKYKELEKELLSYWFLINKKKG